MNDNKMLLIKSSDNFTTAKYAKEIGHFSDAWRTLKSTTVKCHPDDEFNFAIGAFIALVRTFGLEFRSAKDGEYIFMLNDENIYIRQYEIAKCLHGEIGFFQNVSTGKRFYSNHSDYVVFPLKLQPYTKGTKVHLIDDKYNLTFYIQNILNNNKVILKEKYYGFTIETDINKIRKVEQ